MSRGRNVAMIDVGGGQPETQSFVIATTAIHWRRKSGAEGQRDLCDVEGPRICEEARRGTGEGEGGGIGVYTASISSHPGDRYY